MGSLGRSGLRKAIEVLLFGRTLKDTPPFPTDGQIIKFNFANNQWELSDSPILSAVQSSSNVGSGAGWALPRVSDDLPFKSFIVTTPNLLLTVNANDLTLSLNSILDGITLTNFVFLQSSGFPNKTATVGRIRFADLEDIAWRDGADQKNTLFGLRGSRLVLTLPLAVSGSGLRVTTVGSTGRWDIQNIAGSGSLFKPREVTKVSNNSTFNFEHDLDIDPAADTGTLPVREYNSFLYGVTPIINRPIYEWQNNGVPLLTITPLVTKLGAGNNLLIQPSGALGFVDIGEITTPANPAANFGRTYVKDVAGITTLFFRDNAGVETNLLDKLAIDRFVDLHWFQGALGGVQSLRKIKVELTSEKILHATGLGVGLLTLEGISTSPTPIQDGNSYFLEFETTPMAGTDAGFFSFDGGVNGEVTTRDNDFDITIKFSVITNNQARFWIGFFTADPMADNQPIPEHFGFRLSGDAGNTNAVISHSDGVTQAETQIAAFPFPNISHTIRLKSVGFPTNKFQASFDGGSLIDFTTNIPSGFAKLGIFVEIRTLQAASRDFDFFYLDGTQRDR